MKNEILIYETADNQIEITLDGNEETLWLNQKQIAVLFDKDFRATKSRLCSLLGLVFFLIAL